MDNFKYFFVLLIIFSIFIQIGKVFLNSTQYEKIYKFISSFFIIVIVVGGILSIYKKENNIILFPETSFILGETDIKKEFENNLAQMIEANIHNTFYVNYKIKVETDFQQLKIYILCKGSQTDTNVKNYIINNYCTSKDEVYMINEN